MREMRMDAYYYSFSKTGNHAIDKILCAVACAGKSYHHTDDWTNECSPWEWHTGESPVEWIQNAANEAAKDAERARLAIALADALCSVDVWIGGDTSDTDTANAALKAYREHVERNTCD